LSLLAGIPTVGTLVAQHLIKTVSAARLTGADCIISGIRPQIAQTIVYLGLQLDVMSKATMADAFALALKRTGQVVGRAQIKRGMRLVFKDQGPGIADTELAMQHGYSTVGGLGMSVPGSKRLSNEFYVEPAPGKGTMVTLVR
jgi:hypothetical protein